MENYDERRGYSREDERRRARPGFEDRGAERESWFERPEDRRPRRAGRGWLEDDRDYGRGRDEPRYGEGERPRFSPDWSREDERPRYSDEPYYARNRERSGPEDYWRRGPQGGDRRMWEQRARNWMPREQYELAERSEPGDYYDPDWPYQRGRETERAGHERQSGYRSESWMLHGPHTGRGPKGYKRSDQQICEEACQRLERDGEIDASDIEVSAEDGILRLRGTVPDRRTKRRAEECVESIYGVRDVMNELRVSQLGAQTWQREESSDMPRAEQGGRAGQRGMGETARSQAAQGSQSPQKH
jgi:hypothetical protein